MHGISFIYCVFKDDRLLHVFVSKYDAFLYKKKHSHLNLTYRRYPLLEYNKKND